MSEDTFDRLLDSMPRIAEAVNSFASEDVQREAFQALVQAIGLGDPQRQNGSAVASIATSDASPKDAPRVAQVALEVDEDDVEDGQSGRRSQSNGRAKRSRAKKMFNIVKGLNFAPDGKPSLEEFVTEKQPRNLYEKNLVAVYYLTDVLSLEEVGVGHVLAVYQACKWKAPANPENSLQVTASRYGWLDTQTMKDIKVVWGGLNYVNSAMPAKPKASK